MPIYTRWNPKKQCWEPTPELVALLYPIYGDSLWDIPLFGKPPRQHGKKRTRKGSKS